MQRSMAITGIVLAAVAINVWACRDSLLLYAAVAGHPRAARTFVTHCKNIEATGRSGFGITHVAAILNDPELLRDALRRGARVDARSNHGDTALHVASSMGHAEVVRALIVGRADLNTVGANHDTPLRAAVQNGHRAVVEELLRAGADCRVPQPSVSLVDLATAANQPSLLPLLVQCGERMGSAGQVR
jgi:ankyrin repeat protein